MNVHRITPMKRQTATVEIRFSPWRHRLAKLLSCIMFRRIRIYGSHFIPTGPTLFACTHRNGAVDGYVLCNALTRPLFILGSNLTNSRFMRFFFGGHLDINRYPQSIAENRENRSKLISAARMAADGRHVIMFPEGTSWLGPTLRPVRKGMACLIQQALKELPAIQVVPVGLHYEQGNVFRSDVEIHFGSPLHFSREAARNLDTINEALTNALNEVAVNFSSPTDQALGECFAHAAIHLDPDQSHRDLCRSFARPNLPPIMTANLKSLCTQNISPVLPDLPLVQESFRLLLLSMALLPAWILNLPTCLGAFILARKFADDTNVVTLWRILTGLPIFILQTVLLLVAFVVLSGMWTPLFLAATATLTWAGLLAYRPWKTCLTGISNSIYWPRRHKIAILREQIRQLKSTI